MSTGAAILGLGIVAAVWIWAAWTAIEEVWHRVRHGRDAPPRRRSLGRRRAF